jgi:DNA-binding CsgD family transcriptional regulator
VLPETIIGRETELDAVGRFLDRVALDSAALVIEGAAGIGKTTLWLEAIAAGEARSYRVLRAQPTEREAQLSYGALADLVGAVFEETRAALPAPQERALAAALLLADLEEPAEMRTTATALVGVLTALAAEQPVLVAVDDVQWLDPASERVLAFAARRLSRRIGLLLTLRTEGGGALPLELDRALPEERLERVFPGPLSLAGLHHLIKSRLSMSLARPILARLAAASGGNPFFALEIGRVLARDGAERSFDDPLPVPLVLQELVAARVRALSVAATKAVLVASALSRPTVTTVTQALAAQGKAGAALAEAEEAGVLVSDRGRIQFTHPLLASGVYGSVSQEQRRELHRRLAEVVGDPEERARHLALSADEVDEATAAELEQAARQASLRGAQDAAAELFEAACRLTPADRPDELARRLIGRAASMRAVGSLADARLLAEQASAAPAGPSWRAEALSCLAGIDWAEGAMRDANDHLEQALTMASDDQELRGRIYTRLTRINVALDRAVQHADAATQLLSEERAPELLASVLIDRSLAEAMLGRGARRELFARGLELEARAESAAEKHPIPLLWFHFTDDFAAVRARYAEEDALYRELGWESSRADRLGHLALAELRAGRWALAEQYIEQSCSAVLLEDARGPAAMRFAFRSLIDAHCDRVEAAEQVWWTAMSLSTLGFVEFADGDDEAADRALTRMRELIESMGAKEAPLDRSEPFHVETLLALGALERARDALARLEWRGRMLPRLWISTTLPRARALVLAAEGDMAGALAGLEKLNLAAASQLPFELGSTLLVKGRLHRRANQKRLAAEALRQALEIFERLGAPSWAERARGELGRVGLRHRSPHELTPTELRVARLAAGGLTNREVAAGAFMSPKTVEANLSRVYRKLGIRSRAELGALMGSKERDAGAQM